MKTLLYLYAVALPFAIFFSPNKEQPRPSFNKGTWVVQYNASFNKANDYRWDPKPGVNYQYIDLEKMPEFKKLARISHSIPTVIVYKDGKEVKRFESDITFKLAVNQSQILDATK